MSGNPSDGGPRADAPLDWFSDVDDILRRQEQTLDRIEQLVEQLVSGGGQPQPTPRPQPTPTPGDGGLDGDTLTVLRDIRAFLAAESTTFPDEVDLPVGEALPGRRVATVAEEISGGDTGDAFIQLNGAEFVVDVAPNQNVGPGDKVETTGEGRTVEVIQQDRSGATGVSISGTGQLDDRTESVGQDDAAVIGSLGNLTKDFDVPYEVQDTDGTIHVEHSLTGKDGEWDFFTDIDTSSKGREETFQGTTSLNHVRVYADESDFDDDNVDHVIVAAKGV